MTIQISMIINENTVLNEELFPGILDADYCNSIGVRKKVQLVYVPIYPKNENYVTYYLKDVQEVNLIENRIVIIKS